MKKPIIYLIAAFGLVVLIQDFLTKKKNAQPVAPRPYVVMLSLDGFRWDYQDKAYTPSLDSITKYGVKATGLQPCFPSKTFPNHYSIATGLYPGNHELISNSFYAPDLKKYYAIKDRQAVENGKFYKGEPIWVTAESQRVKTGSYFWVGSEAKIKGYQPTYWKRYEHKFPYLQRADSVISWLSKPYKERPKLVTWYLDKADSKGHRYGPESDEVKNAISNLDSVIGYFTQQLQQLDIKDSVNFIIVSDHGMQTVDTNNIIEINKYIKPNWINEIIGSNPFALVYSKKECADSILNVLKKVNGIDAWAKSDIPKEYHYGQSKRVSDIIVVAKNGYGIKVNSRKVYPGGTHGFDNTISDMNGIFYAIGPDFKTGYNAGQLYNVDIYELIAEILEIKPAPNDGQKERIFHILNE